MRWLTLFFLLLLCGPATAAYSPEIIDPREYGARCNGNDLAPTNDHDALQKALDAAMAGRKTVMWPAAV